MLGKIDDLRYLFEQKQVEIFCPRVVQTLREEELLVLVPQFDGWIIGDDPATRRVFEAGKQGLLKAAVKWGVGVDNVDFAAAADSAIPVTNTPNMFGGEVADVAISYVTALARGTFQIDREGFKGKNSQFATLGGMHPVGRIAVPAEIAQAAIFLASPHAAFVTGAANPL